MAGNRGLSRDALGATPIARRCHICGLAAGLALATKRTAYLFLPPLLLAALLAAGRWQSIPRRDWITAVAALGTAILILNGPQYWRNYDLSGSILGFDSAQGDGFFRWRNEHLGWKPTASNLLRNVSDQLGARSPAWNEGVYAMVVRLHQALGIDPQDSDTTWRWSHYGHARNANHEADANNR